MARKRPPPPSPVAAPRGGRTFASSSAPFEGAPLAGPGVTKVDPRTPATYFGQITPDTTDPAFQPPRDPLKGADTALTIYRDIPNVSVQSGWSINQVRGALIDLSA